MTAVVAVGLAVILAAGIPSFMFFLLHRKVLGGFFLIVALVFLGLLVFAVLDLTAAKLKAIRYGHREVDLLFGLVKLVLWEANEGLLFLKNKQIDRVIYGPRQGGGMRYIYPVLGEEIKLHVPLTLQMTTFEDSEVLTRESIQLFIKLAIWWRIKDREGLEKFYLLIDREVHVASDTREDLVAELDYRNTPGTPRKSPTRAELNAAEKWLLTIAEGSLRKLVSSTNAALIISSRAQAFLHVGAASNMGQARLPAPSVPAMGDTTADVLALQVRDALAAETEQYGFEIDRVEVQEARFPPEIQGAIDRVVTAALAPFSSQGEAQAAAIRIRAELEAVKGVLGLRPAAIDRIVQNFQGANCYGGLPQLLQQMFAGIGKIS